MRLWLAIPALAALGARLATGPRPIDDAFITFRYARNLAQGVGLVYNPGEWVLGTTAPFWAVLLGAGYRLGFADLAWLATVLSAACDAATVGLLIWLGLKMGWPPLGAALVGLAWALNPMSIAFATGGMETSLFVLVALTALCFATGRRPVLAAALAGLAALVRPEGLLLACVVVTWTLATARRNGLSAALAAALPVAVGGAAIFAGYGSPLPNSVAAKQVAYLPVAPLENAVALVVQAGLPGWSTYLLAAIPATMGLAAAVPGLIALVDLVRRGVLRLAAERKPWQPFAGFAVLYLCFYVVAGLRGVRLFPWYLVPIEPFYLLGAAAGLAGLRLTRGWWLSLILILWQLPAIDWRSPFLPVGEDLGREQLYLQVGRGLASSLGTNALVAAPEIGALGYASNLRVLDTVGLVSPAALAYYPLAPDQLVTDNAIPPRLIADRRPDAVVTLDAFAQKSLLADPVFEREYQLVATYPARVWQSERLLVFRRVD